MNTGIENDFKYLHSRNLQQLPNNNTKNPSQNIPYNYPSSDEDIEDEYYSDDESQNQLDYEINQLINQQNEKQFKNKFKQLENQSLQRFKSQWDAIIDKYSKIDDSTQSDEIDIVTGELITNNGHLDKLNQNHNQKGDITKMDIWRQDYGQQLENWRQRDFRMKKQAKQRKNEQRQILKKLDLFNKPIYGYPKFEKLEENDFLKQSPTKNKVPSGIESDESPTKKRRVFTDKKVVSKNSNYLEFLDDDDEEVENKSLYTKTVIAHGKLYKRESDNVLYGSSADTFSPYIDRQSFRPESNELQSEDSQDYESNLSSDISDDEYDDETYQSIIINDKKYGFVISLFEYSETIPTLWNHVVQYINDNEIKSELLPLLTNKYNWYNLCHFWSNFEIANLDMFNNDDYENFFQYLDNLGGFYYERWGDAPIHSIAIALFLQKKDIHWFENIGYYHVPYLQCPQDIDLYVKNKCTCNPDEDFTWSDLSCTNHFLNILHN